MKNLNITYEDKDFEDLEKEKLKSGLSWEAFILKAILKEGVKKK